MDAEPSGDLPMADDEFHRTIPTDHSLLLAPGASGKTCTSLNFFFNRRIMRLYRRRYSEIVIVACACAEHSAVLKPSKAIMQLYAEFSSSTSGRSHASFACSAWRDKSHRKKTLKLHDDDDGISEMNAGDYITFRLQQALSEIRAQAAGLYFHYTSLSVCICLLAGVSTVLGLTGFSNWVILSATVANFLQRLLLLDQSEQRLRAANKTSLRLSSTSAWWNSLSSSEKIKQNKIDRMIDQAEQHVQGYITSSLSALKAAYEDEEENGENTEHRI